MSAAAVTTDTKIESTTLSREANDSTSSFTEEDKIYHASFLASIERNQIQLSGSIILFIYVLHLLKIPVITKYTSKFLYLQNQIGTINNYPIYDIHIDDIYYVIYWVIAVTFMRSFLMKFCFSPFAKYFCNIQSRKAKTRFAEQSWSFVYYSVSLAYGCYLYWTSPYFNNMAQVFINWPNHTLYANLKMYYLISTGFWLQQIFVLNIEQHRKDHYQMFGHHIITCCLVIGSYYYYFFRIGHLILMTMDSVDIILSAAKMLKYAKYETACDVMFILFLFGWLITRHGIYNYLFYYIWQNLQRLMAESICDVNKIQKRCWTPGIINVFLGLLGGLQILIIIWMYFICKVAYKVLTGGAAEDVRSDEEDTEDEEEDKDFEQDDAIIESAFEDETDEVEEEEIKSVGMEGYTFSSSSDSTLDEETDQTRRRRLN
ncbi:Sphingosine N-acyltransferase lag1 [Spathaspora sp. JA1]|nr:Sphingosine N-acyltransferase lag1 [Spathaspora sp. JA1]